MAVWVLWDVPDPFDLAYFTFCGLENTMRTIGGMPDLHRNGESYTDELSNIGELYDLLTPPPWHAEAACRRHPELNWYSTAVAPTATRAARAVCATCYVRQECAASAAEHDEQGVWGGERRLAPPDPTTLRVVPPVPVVCSCGRRCRSEGLWRQHARGALEAHPGASHELEVA